jgi:MFS family permease
MSSSAGSDSRSAGGLIQLLCLLWIAGVAMRMTLLVMPPIIPQVHDELRMSETQVGLLIGLPLAVLALAAIPGSLLIARVGASLAVTLGMTIAAIAGAARAAAIDVWTLYAASIVSGFGVAIMQPGMPTLVREWLPTRLALGTIGYSSGMSMGAMFPAILTIAFILPAVGGSWRLDVVLWAIPALLIAPVFLFCSSKILEDVEKQAAGGPWWPNWKNPVVWLLGFTFASNNSPYFVTSAFLGDYLATLGKSELLGAALGWLNGSQLLAMVVSHRQSLGDARMAIPDFRTNNARGISGNDDLRHVVSCYRCSDCRNRCRGRCLDDRDPRPAAVLKFAGGPPADCRGYVHDQLHLRNHHSDDLRRPMGPDRQTVGGVRAALLVRRCTDRAWHGRHPALSGSRPINDFDQD